MTKRGRLRDELRRLGSSPVPVLDPARAQRLERRVLARRAARELELVDADSIDTRRTSRRRSVVVALAAACVLAIVVIGIARPGGIVGSDPVRCRATSRWCSLMGRWSHGSAGMSVPDGAILRLGRNGEAEVDGITVSGAGDYLVTRDGLTLLTTSNPSASDSSPTTGPDDPSTAQLGHQWCGAAPGPTEPAPAITVVRPTTTERDPAHDRRSADDDRSETRRRPSSGRRPPNASHRRLRSARWSLGRQHRRRRRRRPCRRRHRHRRGPSRRATVRHRST